MGTGRRWSILLGPIALLLGTLATLLLGVWAKQYGHQAMLWPQLAVLFNPAGENAGLMLAAGAVLCCMKGLDRSSPSWRWFAASGALVGICMNVHTYSFLWTVAIVVLATLSFYLLTRTKRAFYTVAASLVVTFAIVASGFISAALALFVFVIAGFGASILVVPEWRRSMWRPAVAFVGVLVVTASPLVLRIVADVLPPESYLSFRQQVAQDDPLSLPLGPVLATSALTLLLVACATASLARRVRDTHERTWLSGIMGIIGASCLLVFNAAWGMNQEPYRFYPYALLFLAMAAGPWLITGKSVRSWCIRTIVAVLSIATIPTTAQFYANTKGLVVRFTPGEQQIYSDIAASLPPSGLTLIDTCISRRAFKVMTGAKVVDYNLGLAVPERLEAINAVHYEQIRGVLPSADTLAAADVTAFVTMNQCQQVDPGSLQKRFGAPVAVLPAATPEVCGMPATTTYSVYRTDAPGPDVNASVIPGFDAERPQNFVAGVGGEIKPNGECGYGFNTVL